MSILIATIVGKPDEIETVWEKDGLAVHLTPCEEEFVDNSAEDGFSITHINSGASIIQWMCCKDDAIDLADDLLAIGDWTRDSAALAKDEPFYQAVFGVLEVWGLARHPTTAELEQRRQNFAMYAASRPITPEWDIENYWLMMAGMMKSEC